MNEWMGGQTDGQTDGESQKEKRLKEVYRPTHKKTMDEVSLKQRDWYGTVYMIYIVFISLILLFYVLQWMVYSL